MDSQLWHDLFALGMPPVEKVIRLVAIYLALVIGLRLAGKRTLAQLNPFDLVVLLLLSNAVQNAMIGSDNSLSGGLLGVAILLLANYGLVRFLFSRRKLDEIVEGEEDVLFKGGHPVRENLRRELIRLPQLEAAARKQGFLSLKEVDRAILEPGGTLVFLGKKTTAGDLRYQELLERLDRLTREVAALRAERRVDSEGA